MPTDAELRTIVRLDVEVPTLRDCADELGAQAPGSAAKRAALAEFLRGLAHDLESLLRPQEPERTQLACTCYDDGVMPVLGDGCPAHDHRVNRRNTEPEQAATEKLDGLLARVRALGWAVAVHNDYRLNGVSHTFWLFTKGESALKGEGLTDADAVSAVLDAAERSRT